MRRREFIAGLAGAATWPVVARAQQSERMRRVGVLMGWAESDPEAKSDLAAFVEELKELGWVGGRNLRIDYRWAGGSAGRMRTFAKELVELQPDVILANTTPVTSALQHETHTIPIVFVVVSDPIGAGFLASLPRPGGNITGFINIKSSLGGKWLELLIEIAPPIQRVAIMFNPDTAPGGGLYFLGPFEAAAHSFGVEPITAPVRSDAEIERVITRLGNEPRGGLVVMTDGFMMGHRGPIIALAARSNVPAIYAEAVFVQGWRIAVIWSELSGYVSPRCTVCRSHPQGREARRFCRFESQPVFQLVINLKTAKALGMTVPNALLARADEVIE